MKGSFVIGKIKGILIEVNISWFVIFALVTYSLASGYLPVYYPDFDTATRWILGGIISLLFFISVLLHELSHSLISTGLGIPVKNITLFIFGGVAQIEKEPDEPGKELKIAIAGPAMSLLLSVLFLLLSKTSVYLGAPEPAAAAFTYLSDINLTLALFNLFPAFPLDGGRILRAVIWHFSKNLQKATRISSAMGELFGYSLIAIGVFLLLNNNIINGLWLLFIGWFINQMSKQSYQSMLISDIFKNIQVSKFMTDKVVTVDYNISVQELIEDYFYKYKFAIFPVKQNDEIVGIVLADSIKQLQKESRLSTSVGEITTSLTDNLVVSADDTVTAAMTKLSANGIGRVIVMDHGNLLGIVSNTDILNYISLYSKLNT